MPHSSATVQVQMLDHSVHTYDVKVKSYGNMLLQSVMKDINLLESDYFGIQYTDRQGNRVFLDPLKKIKSQITNISNVVLHFVVKFFPPDPGQLQEEYTRYLFALQVKQDIVDGLLPCNENTLVVMASYIAQSEFGDWNSFDCSDLSYLRDLKLLPPLVDMNEHDLLVKVSENHKIRTGETKADSDYHLLDIVRRLEQYGLRLLPAKDQENTDIKLAVAHMGVVVFRGNSKINTFNWARIRKLSFKKKRFLIKLRTETSVDKNGQNVGDILVFVMASRDTCKNFWRHCIEYHAFFRLEIHPDPAPKPKIIKRGSTFRYSGKTQKQLHELVRNSNFRRTTFVRASARKPTIQPNNRTPQFNSPAITVTPSVISTEHDDSGIPSPIKTEAEVNGHVTTTPDLTMASKGDGLVYSQKEEKPEELSPSSMATAAWQVESEHLHSSVVSVPSHETPDEAPGNNSSVMHDGHINSNNSDRSSLKSPDILNGHDVIITTSPTNDNSENARDTLKSNTSSADSPASRISKSRSNSTRSGSSSSYKYNSHPLPPPPPPPPPTGQDDGDDTSDTFPSPPPLPPKSARSTPAPVRQWPKMNGNTPAEYINTDDLNIKVKLRKPPRRSESNASKNLSAGPQNPALKSIHDQNQTISLSASEVSIPGMGGGEPRTPSQYAALEQKMIKAGFYSVPTRPPIPDDAETSNMDSDIDKALHELDIATRTLACNGSNEGSDLDDSENEMYEDEMMSDGEFRLTTPNKRILPPKNILTPIAMKFDDHYTAPDYGSNDALSSFAVEMEASFDRIRESLSVDKLDQHTAPPNRHQLSSSVDVLSMQEADTSFYNVSDGFNNNNVSLVGRNANNNESFGPGLYRNHNYEDTLQL